MSARRLFSLSPDKLMASRPFRVFGLFVLTFGCSRLDESGITCIRRRGMGKSVKRSPKKPYSVPVLTVYGTVQQLTQAVGLRKNPDNGRAPRVRTAL